MPTKKISLSPEKMIILLHDIEKKLPYRKYKMYSPPITTNDPIPLVALNREAKKMMNFVGLSEFEPYCEWADLPKETAGNILLNGSMDGAIKIQISKTYQSNGKATLAILAHEICHKLLEYHGLYYSNAAFTELNEIYTELTTVFIGFGQIILSGYSTFNNGINYSLGYLEYLDYGIILQLVEALYTSKMISSPLLGGSENIINKWISADSQRQLYLNGFITEQKDVTECLKNLSMLQEAISILKDDLYSKQLELHQKYFIESDTSNVNGNSKPIHQFYMANPWLWNTKDFTDQIRLTNISEIAKSFLAYMGQFNPRLSIEKVKPFIFFCPKCGKKNENSNCRGKQIIVKCPECATRFYIDCSEVKIESIKTIYLKSNDCTSKKDTELNKKESFWNFFKKRNNVH